VSDITQLLFHRILDALPQTQCQRCSYVDCEAYARAIVNGDADIDQCPTGGHEGVAQLAEIVGRSAKPVNPEFGQVIARQVAFIDENWCIGCTLCLPACPVDAIVGSNKKMHTVLEKYCTGCALCVPACPVDCIALESITGEAVGWDAWSKNLADQAKLRYEAHTVRFEKTREEKKVQCTEQLEDTIENLANHSKISAPQELKKKYMLLQAILKKSKNK
jgi:Na+-translocating ferredoxin:NAD+ oxidoreductase subunit B